MLVFFLRLNFNGSVNIKKIALCRLILRRLGLGGSDSIQLGFGGGYTGFVARRLSSTLPGA